MVKHESQLDRFIQNKSQKTHFETLLFNSLQFFQLKQTAEMFTMSLVVWTQHSIM